VHIGATVLVFSRIKVSLHLLVQAKYLIDVANSSVDIVEREVVNDGSSGHSQCDLEESTYVAGMKATLPSTNRWLDCSESAFAQ
jgi:hypothetical protein